MSGGAFNAAKWLFIRNISRQVVSFAFTVFLARILSPNDFGLASVLFVFIEITTLFMDMGFAGALIQKKNPTEEDYSTVFFLNVLVGLFLSTATFLFSDPIAVFLEKPELSLPLKVIAVVFLISSLNIVQSTRQTKELNFSFKTKLNLFTDIFSGIVAIVMALNGFGFWSLVFKTIFSSVLNTLFYWILVKWRPLLVVSMQSIKDLGGFGFKMFGSALLDLLFSRMDIFIIAKMSTSLQVGLYSRAKSLNELSNRYTIGSIAGVFYPLLSKHQDDEQTFTFYILKYFRMVSLLVFPMAVILYTVSEELITVLYSAKWIESAVYLKILILGAPIYPFSFIVVNAISARGKAGLFLKLEIIKKAILLISVPIGFYYGFMMYLWVYLALCYVCLAINMLFLAYECMGISIIVQLKQILPSVCISIALLIILYLGKYFILSGLNLWLVLSTLALSGIVAYWILNKLIKPKAYLEFRDLLMDKLKLKGRLAEIL